MAPSKRPTRVTATHQRKPPDTVTQSTRTQRYHVRAVIHGTIYTTCPWCGNKNASRLSVDTCIVECTGPSCAGRFYPAVRLVPTPRGRAIAPQDWAVPDGLALRDAFPLGELSRDVWTSGQRVHDCYVTDERRELEIVERFLARADKHRSSYHSDPEYAAIEEEVERMKERVNVLDANYLERFGRAPVTVKEAE